MAIKNFIRKSISLMLAGLMGVSMCACSFLTTSSDKLSIVTTIFPEYDWVRNIAGDNIGNIDLTLLCDNGVDMHSFQPTASDIVKISSCDVFVYVGGESDEWVEDVLKEAVNKEMQVVKLMDVIGESAVEEEIVEGMQAEDEGDEEGGVEYDEHVWLSLKNASVLCDAITDALSKADAENAAVYQANNDAYKAQLSALDAQYKEVVESATFDTLLFGDRFPFRYLTDDYNLNYYAAFVGCSAESEASFETIVFLADKTDELGLNSIMIIESSDGKIAQTIRDNTEDKNQEICVLDSMQSITSDDVKKGVTYLSVMTANLEVLKQALN